MEYVERYLPRDLANLVDEYYTTYRPITDATYPLIPGMPLIRWRALFEFIGNVLNTLRVSDMYNTIMYQFYDYHMRIWVTIRKKIPPSQYQLFGLQLLYRVAPAPFQSNQMSPTQILMRMLGNRFLLSDFSHMNKLIETHTTPVMNCNLFPSITSAITSSWLESKLSRDVFISVFSKAPDSNQCLAESLLSWIITLARWKKLKIKLDKWPALKANIRPLFNNIPLWIFYGIGPVTIKLLNASTLGAVNIEHKKPKHVSTYVWSNLTRIL